MNKIKIIGVGLLGWLIGAMMFVRPVAVEQRPETKVEVTPTMAVSMQDVFYKEYMKSCTEGIVVNEQVCDCMYKYVLKEVGFEGMYKMASSLKEGELPDVYMRAAVACVK